MFLTECFLLPTLDVPVKVRCIYDIGAIEAILNMSKVKSTSSLRLLVLRIRIAVTLNIA